MIHLIQNQLLYWFQMLHIAYCHSMISILILRLIQTFKYVYIYHICLCYQGDMVYVYVQSKNRIFLMLRTSQILHALLHWQHVTSHLLIYSDDYIVWLVTVIDLS